LAGRLYLDTSVALRGVLEQGATAEEQAKIRSAELLLTSRLSLVESARALLRIRRSGEVPEARIADAERQLANLFARCEIWELTEAVCSLARQIAPAEPLRALDALHLATFALARRRIEGLELFTTDRRLASAAASD
jgi:predicted nucleic acid-binding protein